MLSPLRPQQLPLKRRVGHDLGRLDLEGQQFDRGAIGPLLVLAYGARLRINSRVLPGNGNRFEFCQAMQATIRHLGVAQKKAALIVLQRRMPRLQL